MKNNYFNNSCPEALLVENIHKKTEMVLEDMGFTVKRLKKSLNPKELIEHLRDAKALCVRSRTQINKEMLLKSRLDCIGAFCIGVNHIDLETASKQGVPVFNAPYSNTRSVAEMVIGLMIGLSRSLFDHSKNMHQGLWHKFAEGCFELRGKTVGIIGYGHIGSQVSVLAEVLGMKVLYYDVVSKLPIGNAKPVSSLKHLLEKADFITLHVPETSQTKNLIGEKEIGFMKKTSHLINTSRGSVVNISAVQKALDAQKIAGVAIDVFPKEPQSRKDHFSFPLQNKKHVVLTPHVGGSTEEAQASIVAEVCKSLQNFLFTGTTQDAVNFPSLVIPPLPENVTRISNIHKNQPGVLSQINKLVSESRVNIKTQYLATNEWIGYLVMDLEKEDVHQLCQRISRVNTSIKTRIIASRLDRSKSFYTQPG